MKNVLGTNYSKLLPISDSGLINGRGRFDCSLVGSDTTCNANADYATFRFQSEKTHRLRLINSGADGKSRRLLPAYHWPALIIAQAFKNLGLMIMS